MPVRSGQLVTNLFLLEELEDPDRTQHLADGDRTALRAVADWTKAFVAKPHAELGRPGPVCPFVPGALERNTLWLAAEHVAGRGPDEIAERITDYQRLFLEARPVNGEDTVYKSYVVVFIDLPVDRAGAFFDDLLARIAIPSYAKDGFVMGGFFESNQGTALYSTTLRPFTSPVPFLLVRQAVVSDWKFFLDNDALLELWARRYADAGAHELAAQLRQLPWRDAGHR
jgi:Domain of unknown function (DUF6875)